MDTLKHSTVNDSGKEAAAAGEFAMRAPADAAHRPPSGNTGGKFHTEIDPISGESFIICTNGNGKPQIFFIPQPVEGVNPYSAITDYFNCTFRFDSEDLLPALFQNLFIVLGDKFAPAVNRERGLHGYKKSFRLGDSSALFAYGGQSGTAFLSLPGEACSLVADWHIVVRYLRDTWHANITRWDGAVDDFAGVHTVDMAVELYQSGTFNAGGNKPSCNQNGNWIEPDGKGRTFYVGKRKNGKMLRIYEKGMQLGGLWHPWVRWEVELHNTDRIIPWEVLTESGRYFVGSYPKALSWVQEPMTRIKTIKRQTQIGYEHLVESAATAYGKLFNVMLDVEGSAESVLKILQRDGTPRRLQHPFVDKQSEFLDAKNDLDE